MSNPLRNTQYARRTTKYERLTTNDGFILLFTLIMMTTLSIIAGALIYMMTYETKGVGSQTDDVNLEAIADAGVELAHRAIRDDYLGTSPDSATGVADLRCADTSLSLSVTNPDRMRYIGEASGGATFTTGTAIASTFSPNYTNTRIISVELMFRVAYAGGNNATTVQASYTLDGVNYITTASQVLTSNFMERSRDITTAQTKVWANLMSPNFRLRLVRLTGNRGVNLDALYLRVNYTIDTLKESWSTGDYATFPVSLSNGTIQSTAITDEESKVHLNYASEALLTNLLTNLGIGGAAAKAANIVTYRGALLTNPFDSVEELQQVPGITAPDYTAVKDYVTVYSFVNSNVYTPAGPRAPININTASSQVLKSVFDSLGLGAGDAQALADDIINERKSRPFKGFYYYPSTASNNTYFYNFVRNRSYLTATGNPDEQDKVLDTADPSSPPPVAASAAYACPTTELCYAGTVFNIDALANYKGRGLHVRTLRGNDGSHTFATYSGDPVLNGWRRESYE